MIATLQMLFTIKEFREYILDYDLWIRIACLGKVYIIHEPLNFFRVRNDSNTGEVMAGGKKGAYVSEHRYLVKKYAKEISEKLDIPLRTVYYILNKK